jgi:glycosyltransferase involved in cell wall biosynthesis
MGNEKRRTIKLSVIIPCLNAGATLATQLEALAAQHWSEPWELILADNGSNDGSMDIAREYGGRFPSLQIIDASARKGSSYARNAGVRVAKSDRLAFCDADDEVAPGWVASMGEALNKYNMVYGRFRFDKFNLPYEAELSTRAWENGLYKGRFLPGGGAGNLGIRRWLHEAIGGFDEILLHAEDADYYWKLQLRGFELHYVPDAVVQVRMGRVNPSLCYLFHRAKNRSANNYWLYKRYRHLGMLPPQALKESLVIWVSVLRRAFPNVFFKNQKRVAWLQLFAEKTGVLVGQFHGRIKNPCKPYHPDDMKTSCDIPRT